MFNQWSGADQNPWLAGSCSGWCWGGQAGTFLATFAAGGLGVAGKLGDAADAIDASAGAINAPIDVTQAGEQFVRVGASPENLNATYDGLGGTLPRTYAFDQATFDWIGNDPAALKNFGDLPGAPPTMYRILEPPAGTPIQRGIVPGGVFGGEGGVPEVFFPEGW